MIVSAKVMKKAQSIYDKEGVIPFKESHLAYYFIVKGYTGRYEIKINKQDHSKYSCTCTHGSGPRFNSGPKNKKKVMLERCSHWVACLIWIFKELKITPTMEEWSYGDFQGIES